MRTRSVHESRPHSQTKSVSGSGSPKPVLIAFTRSFTSRKSASFSPILSARSSTVGQCSLSRSSGAGREEAFHGSGGEQEPGDVGPGGTQGRHAADREAGNRGRPALVHRPRGSPEELLDHYERGGGRARRRHGLRRLV